MLVKSKLEKGSSYQVMLIVGAAQTANFFSQENEEKYAEVLGTPFLIAEMERVCANLMKPLLGEDEVSVGAHINIRHLAPTAVGDEYKVKATFEGSRWGLYTFSVEAQNSEEVIGKGEIVRAISKTDEILRRANINSAG